MSFARNGDSGFETVVSQSQLLKILASFVGLEIKDKLLVLANLQYAFTFGDLETRRTSNLPLSLLLAYVTDHDRFFGVEFDWHESELDLVWEVKASTATHSADGDDELFALSDDDQVVGIVVFSLGGKLNDICNVHSRCYFAGHRLDVFGLALGALRWVGSRLLGGGHRKEFRVRRDDPDRASDLVFIPTK